MIISTNFTLGAQTNREVIFFIEMILLAQPAVKCLKQEAMKQTVHLSEMDKPVALEFAQIPNYRLLGG